MKIFLIMKNNLLITVMAALLIVAMAGHVVIRIHYDNHQKQMEDLGRLWDIESDKLKPLGDIVNEIRSCGDTTGLEDAREALRVQFDRCEEAQRRFHDEM